MKKLIFGVFLILALAGGAAGYLLLTDKAKPEIVLTPDNEMAAPKREFTLTLRDAGSGLKNAKVVVSQDDKQITLLDKPFAAPVRDSVETFTLEPAGLHDGPFVLTVTATDRSIANFGAGNTASLTRQLTLDTTPATGGRSESGPYRAPRRRWRRVLFRQRKTSKAPAWSLATNSILPTSSTTGSTSASMSSPTTWTPKTSCPRSRSRTRPAT